MHAMGNPNIHRFLLTIAPNQVNTCNGKMLTFTGYGASEGLTSMSQGQIEN